MLMRLFYEYSLYFVEPGTVSSQYYLANIDKVY